MKNWQPKFPKIDYQERGPDRRIVSMYLQAEYLRRRNRLQNLNSPGKTGRLILYVLSGILFAVGLFFVLF